MLENFPSFHNFSQKQPVQQFNIETQIFNFWKLCQTLKSISFYKLNLFPVCSYCNYYCNRVIFRILMVFYKRFRKNTKNVVFLDFIENLCCLIFYKPLLKWTVLMPFSRKSAASSGSRFSIEVEIRCGQIAQQAGVATTSERPISSTVSGFARAGFLASRRPGFLKFMSLQNGW